MNEGIVYVIICWSALMVGWYYVNRAIDNYRVSKIRKRLSNSRIRMKRNGS